MSDLQKYISKRKRRDSEFAEGFETGYANFKVGVLLRQAREKAGLTQDQRVRYHCKCSSDRSLNNFSTKRSTAGRLQAEFMVTA